MKPRRKKAAARRKTFRVWTYGEARQALPYIASVMASVREHHLQAIACRLRARRLRDRPGRPERAALIALQEAQSEAATAKDQLETALKELWRLNVYCLDPVEGVALLPFAHPDQQLAWYIFELFAENRLGCWRFQQDSLETHRPLTEEVTAPTLNV